MTKRMTIMLVGVIILFGGVLGWHYVKAYFISQYFDNMQAPAQTVAVVTATTETWQPTLQSVGSLRAVRGVDLTTETGGTVAKIDFKSGDRVNAGDLLLQLRVTADKAQLRGLEAAAKLAELDYRRDQKLIKRKAISTSQLQRDHSKYENAKAAVAHQKALIAKKTIVAPFSGELGVRQVDLGQLVSPGTTVVTLQALDSLYVDFSLPQTDLQKVHRGQQVELTIDAYPGKTFVGKINAIEPKMDRATRNFNLQATVANKKRLLRPGMFSEIKVDLSEHPQYVTVPRTAISYNTYGDYVYVIKKKESKGSDKDADDKTQKGDPKPTLTVHQQVVKTGLTRGDQVAVLKGLKAGQRVVVAGQIKLHDGTRVNINNKVLPPNNPNPTVLSGGLGTASE